MSATIAASSWTSGSLMLPSVGAFGPIALSPSTRALRPSRVPVPNHFLNIKQQPLSSRLVSSAASDLPPAAEVPTGGSSAVLSQKPQPLPTNATQLQMLSFYHFEPVSNPLSVRDALFTSINAIPGLCGTIYVANEGVNAQLAVPLESLDGLLSACVSALPFDPFSENAANLGDVVDADTPTFNRLVVRVRDYILRDGIPQDVSLDWTDAGPELPPSEWHQQVQNEEAVVIDCRNVYESEEGTFEGALPLGTETFQESWEKIDELASQLDRTKPVHIFCTGGIRCVKVGAYMKQHLQFSNVKRLQHGIVGYDKWLEQQPDQTSAFSGNNFLFDKRRFAEQSDDKNS